MSAPRGATTNASPPAVARHAQNGPATVRRCCLSTPTAATFLSRSRRGAGAAAPSAPGCPTCRTAFARPCLASVGCAALGGVRRVGRQGGHPVRDPAGSLADRIESRASAPGTVSATRSRVASLARMRIRCRTERARAHTWGYR